MHDATRNLLFVIIRRRAPRSTLFPYTALFLSDVGRQQHLHVDDVVAPARRELLHRVEHGLDEVLALVGPRSEEHTSVQSRQYLVCRLLLEKKQKQVKQDSLNKRYEESTSINNA